MARARKFNLYIELVRIMENQEMMYMRIIVIAIVITGLVQTSSYAGCDCDDWMQKGGYCVDYIKTKIPTFAIPKSVHELETLKNKNIFEVTAGDVAIFELSDRWHVAYVENVHSDRFGLATSIDVTEMNFGQQLSFGAYRNIWKQNSKNEWERSVCCGVTNNYDVIDSRKYVDLNTVKQIWSPIVTVSAIHRKTEQKDTIIVIVKDALNWILQFSGSGLHMN